MKIHYTDPDKSDYPQQLLTLSQFPPRIAYWGAPVWQEHPMISIVGSRSPMDDSIMWLERHLPSVLRRLNLAVVSGGARGIDQLAHRLSVQCGQPTICVLPSGLKNPYPTSLQPLLEEIVRAGGVVMSTYDDFQPVRTHHFAIRNRWIAGLSKVCFVVEANRRSGSILTARMAIAEDRDVATLPVSPLSGQGLGNLDLLAEGQQIIRTGEDLFAMCCLQYP